MPKALTWNLFVQKARAVHGDKYTYPDQAYTNVNTPVLIVCERHSGFRQCPNDHLYNKAGCPECFSEKRQQVAERRRLTSAAYEQRANIKHGGRYAYPNLRYELGNKHITKCTITVRCPDHGEFTQNAANHLYASGCEDCGRLKTTASITEPREEVWKRIKAAHGDRYTYLNWDEYRTTHFRLKIKCSNPSHPPFFQTVIEHIQRRGCRLCGYTKRDQTTQRKHFATFLDRANKAHPDAHYRYPQLTTEFVNNCSWITVVCPRHNTFRQQVSTHLSGRGCLDCAAIARSAAQRKTVKYLLDSAIKAHRDKGYWYPYVDEEYRNRNSVVTVGCPNCQLFFNRKSPFISICDVVVRVADAPS